MAVIVAVLLTLAYIKAGVARILDNAVGTIGADGKGEAANYDREGRAFVLTTVEPDGSATWTGKACGKADTVVRVYAAALSESKYHVVIGCKWQGGRADRAVAAVECGSREAAETLLTATLLELAAGKNTGVLSRALPRVFHGRKLVERPDQHRSGGRKATAVATLTDDATAAMQAAIKAAETADAKPADKAKA
jgi:hypothetical protein